MTKCLRPPDLSASVSGNSFKKRRLKVRIKGGIPAKKAAELNSPVNIK